MKSPNVIVPFKDEEMMFEERYESMFPGVPGIPVLKTPIPPYENLKILFAHEKPLWMPSFQEFKMFNPRILPDNIARAMVVEQKMSMPESIYNKDIFGIEWEFVPTVMGSIVRPGAPKVADLNEWEKYIEWPDLEKLDWEGCARENADFLNDPRPIEMTVFSGFFERLISFVDMTDALIAMIDEDTKPAVHRLFDKLATLYDQLFYLMSKWFNPDLIWFHDDWGSQRASLFSEETCREMILPYLKRTVESAHRYGMGINFHSCGKIENMVPVMIDAGCDMWDGQPMNDKGRLYKEYGEKIILSVDPVKLEEGASQETLEKNVSDFLEEFPSNVYVGMSFDVDIKYYPEIYKQSRIKYNS